MARRFCPLMEVIVWIKRSTGIGYVHPDPFLVERAADVEAWQELGTKADDLVIQVERLERELRRRGHLPSPRH